LSDLTVENGEKRVSRSIFVKILIFSGLIVLSAAAMRPVQAALGRAMSHIKTNLIGKIETATGIEVQYSSIRPSIFGSFDIRNLRLLKNDSVFLSISRTRISFSLMDLLRGKKTAVKSIQIERPVISIDTEKDRELLMSLKSLTNSDTSSDDSLAHLTEFFPDQGEVRIRNLSFNITSGPMAGRIGEMDIDINGDGSRLLLDSKLHADFRYSDLFNKNYTVKTEALINGNFPTDLQDGRAEIVFTSITASEQDNKKRNGLFFMPASVSTGEFLDIRSLGFEFLYKDNIITVRALGDDKYSGSFNFNTETLNISAEVDCRNFIPSEVFIFSGAYKNVNSLLSMAVTGGASFNYEKTGAMRYNVNFNGLDTVRKEKNIVINLHGGEESITVDDFHFSVSKTSAEKLFHGNFGFSGSMGFTDFSPEGTIFFENFSINGKEDINAVLLVSNSGNEIHVSGETLKFSQSSFHDLDIFLYPSEGDLGVTASVFCENEGNLSLEAAFIYEPRQLDVSLSFDSFLFTDIVEVYRPFSNNTNLRSIGKSFIRNATITADSFFTTDFDKFVYNAPNIVIKDENIEGLLSISGTDRQITLNDSVFTRNETDFYVSANVNFSNPNDLDFSFNANFLDLSWNLEGNILDMSTLIISDPNGLHAYGNISNSGAVSGYVEGIDFPIPIDGHPVYLNFYVSLRHNAKDFWSVDVAQFEARNIGSLGDNGIFKVSGSLDQDGASFRNILYKDNVGDLAGGVDFFWDSDFSYLRFNLDITDGREAGETFIAEGILKNDHFGARASIAEVRADRYIKGLGKILLNGEAELSWDSIQAFNLKLDLTSISANVRGNEVNASAEVNCDHDMLAVNGLKINFADFNINMPSLSLSRTESAAKAAIYVSGLAAQDKVEGKIELDAKFNNMDSWMDFNYALGSFDGSIRMDNIIYRNNKQEPFAFLFSKKEGALSVSGGPGNMIRLEMDKEGNFFASLSDPLPIHSTLVGNYKDGMIDAYCNDFFMDISGLWDMIPKKLPAAISGGYITAKVDIRGKLLNPEFFGTAKGTSFRITVEDYLRDDIKLVPFYAELEGYELSFNKVPASVGKGGGLVDGWFRFENWVPEDFGLVITVPRSSPIPYKANINGFFAEGDASGILNLTMDNSVFEAGGDLVADNTEMGVRADEMHAMTDNDNNSGNSSIINFTITTGPVVEFVWPNKNMPILRANPEMGTVIKVYSDSLTMQYTLNSDIKIRSGELFYFDRSFYIRQGNLVLRENEQQFNPRLSARAEIRDRTDIGPVTISMIIENQPLLTFTPRFEASPVLTQLEIYSLLGQNTYGIGNENSGDSQRFLLSSTTDLLVQLASSNDFLAQFVSARQLERRIRNLFRLDMFSIRTRLIQNAVANAAVGYAANTGTTDDMAAPVDRNNRVGNYFDNTSVFVGKYVGQDMFIQGMLSLRYDDNYQAMGGLRLEPDIGIELQSPLFSIRWDFFPYHPENWWLNDNSITLLWSKSF